MPRRARARDIIDLGSEQGLLMDEIATVSRALKDETRCDKLNVAAIGNVVPQLHIHVVARRGGDLLWPKPVWGATAERRFTSVRHLAGLFDRYELHRPELVRAWAAGDDSGIPEDAAWQAELWRRLRDERSFDSESDLVEQIARDVAETRAVERPV